MIQDKKESPNVEVKTTGRRKFLAKASAGALISTIPAKSVWATGLTNSIVASGHGSDFGGTTPVSLRPVSFWADNPGYLGIYQNVDFQTLFGGMPFQNNGQFNAENAALGDMFSKGKYKGKNEINWLMIAVTMNAYRDGSFGIHYPVIGPGKPFASVQQLARYLYSSYNGNNATYTAQLLHVLNHTG